MLKVKPHSREHRLIEELMLTLCYFKNRHVHFNLKDIHVVSEDCDGVMNGSEFCEPDIAHINKKKADELEDSIKQAINLIITGATVPVS